TREDALDLHLAVLAGLHVPGLDPADAEEHLARRNRDHFRRKIILRILLGADAHAPAAGVMLLIVGGELALRAPGVHDAPVLRQFVLTDSFQRFVADEIDRLSRLGLENRAEKQCEKGGSDHVTPQYTAE